MTQYSAVGSSTLAGCAWHRQIPMALQHLQTFVAVAAAVASDVRERFELAPQMVVLETGTLAREFEANVKAARFVDRRGA